MPTRDFPEATQRMTAQLIERAVDDMRTDAVIRPRWFGLRPFWQTGYDRALRDVHEEVCAVLDACDIWHPAASDSSVLADSSTATAAKGN
jgi:hypothetical protein